MDEPVDQRVTAAQLVDLRARPDGPEKIAELLQVERMPPTLQQKCRDEIERFVASGDATQASQLIHASIVRRRRKSPLRLSNN